MDGKFDLITILSLVIAVVAILKLRSVLGKRTGDEQARIDQRARAEEARQRASAEDKVITLPRRDREPEKSPAGAGERAARQDSEAKLKTFAAGNAELERSLLAISQSDPSFDAAQFMAGAKAAYEMIVTAFAEGNRKVLKDLLSGEVFEGFSTAIADRERRSEQVDQSFVGINKADMLEAVLKSRSAQVTVKFVSQLISATRDQKGEVVSGDPQKIKEVTDIWTFARDVTSRDPNWRLIATQAPN